ncbi:protein of unknown function [Paramicrobacterium humi]|uniref:Protein-glutamine gamma-glutamyltransferase-like C-terminal domain-containing protein n=1 Tax=Paramicrobacterium humi TaxID=640635 RepID=A0A1H4P303_9MICO|nr:DUF4129 domain-containing protein [Microbacterium humi]SEC01876.1 protein of unknown function [Microbacterium humi]
MIIVGDQPPLDPDRQQAYDWLVRELSNPEYTAAQPTLLDRIAQAIREWLNSLLVPGDGTLAAWVPVIIVLLVVAAVVTALVIWGMPRRNRAAANTVGLFGDDDVRTARELRQHARDEAARADWESAVLDAFRGLTRGLAERTIVVVDPGTTANGVARQAADAFPAEADGLRLAASVFDQVRYLDVPAGREQYAQIAELDGRVQALAPRMPEAEVRAT